MRNAVLDPDGYEVRFAELRFDAETRTVSGRAMRYGDIAEFPWGEKEMFKAGAFGNLTAADVSLDVQHDRGRLLARTNGGDETGAGRLLIVDNHESLRVEAKLPNTTEANDAIENIRTGILRGLSVHFIIESYEWDKKTRTATITKAKLIRIGVVDIPAYPDSTIDRMRAKIEGQDDMDEDQVRAIVDEALAKRDGDEPIDAAALARSLAEAVGKTVDDTVEAKLTEAFEARDKAEADRKAAEDKAEEERKAAEKAAADAEANAEARAELLVMLSDLLPDGTETRGKSNKDLLVLAVGDEIDDAEDRSEDYLRAKVEGIIERRENATKGAPTRKPNRSRSQGSTGVGRVNVLNMPRSA